MFRSRARTRSRKRRSRGVGILSRPVSNRRRAFLDEPKWALLADLDDAARRVALGDVRAFRAIVDATGDRLHRLALRMTGDADDARDVVQDAYVRAHAALVRGGAAEWKGDASVETWLYRIVVNTALNDRRGRERRARLAEASEPAPRAASAETSADVARLVALVKELPPEQRAAVVLKELEGLTSAEAGAVLGCSEGAIEQRVLRARATLKKRMSDEREGGLR
jgi:RNA polymerase sigma-70 factor (ECF subfamily)